MIDNDALQAARERMKLQRFEDTPKVSSRDPFFLGDMAELRRAKVEAARAYRDGVSHTPKNHRMETLQEQNARCGGANMVKFLRGE